MRFSQKLQKKSLKPFLEFKVVQGIDVNKTKKPVASACYDKQTHVRICNRFHVTRANSIKITTFRKVSPLTPACVGLLELSESRLRLLKSTLNAKNFVRRLPGAISSHFGAIHSLKCVSQPEITKKVHENF